MGDSAFVLKSSLDKLDFGIASVQKEFQAYCSQVDYVFSQFILYFENALNTLQEKIRICDSKLQDNERHLERIRRRSSDDRDSAQERMLQHRIDNQRQYIDQLESKCAKIRHIISSAQTQKHYVDGSSRLLSKSTESARVDLSKYQKLLEDFMKIHTPDNQSYQDTHIDTDYGTLDDFRLERKEPRFTYRFLYANGQPIIGKNVVIIDNSLGGFGKISLFTDENGEVSAYLKDSDDCSIYLDKEEIYSGKMRENLLFKQNHE